MAWRIVLAFACLSSGCQNNRPGEPVGSYRVEGRLVDNECGQTGQRFRSSFSYRVELRHDADTGYWVASSQRPVPGTLNRGDGRFEFQLAQQFTLPARGMTGEPTSCMLRQHERIEGTLEHVQLEHDAGMPMTDGGKADAPGRLNAHNTIEIAPVPGADCSPALAPAGPFPKLPCSARYELDGMRLDP